MVEAAALAHDLGHPPFGHLGERVLDRLARQRLGLPDGFEGNAQSYRIVTSTEIRGAATIGLDLTAAVRAAMLKYPWTRRTTPTRTRGTMDPPPRGAAAAAGRPGQRVGEVRRVRAPSSTTCGRPGSRSPGRIADWQQTVEASVMDTADDIAYAIHDLEDFHRVGVLQQGAVAAELMAWQREAGSCAALTDAALAARPAGPARRSSGCAGSCTARTAGSADDDAFAAAVEQVRAELVDGLLAAPFDGSIEAEQYVARVLRPVDPPPGRRDRR